jgi:hypothetical protein
MATYDKSLSYARYIQPLFRESDRDAMAFAFDLWDYNDVCANAPDILERLSDGSMPCDGEWPEEQINQFQNWMDAGMPA